MRIRHPAKIVSVATAVAILLLIATTATAHAAPSEFEELREKGLFLAYLGVFAAGFLTSLTPCVYPMITITVGIFGAREAQTRLRAFGLAWMYVLGMVVMFSALGVVFALSGRASGSGSGRARAPTFARSRGSRDRPRGRHRHGAATPIASACRATRTATAVHRSRAERARRGGPGRCAFVRGC